MHIVNLIISLKVSQQLKRYFIIEHKFQVMVCPNCPILGIENGDTQVIANSICSCSKTDKCAIHL